MADGEEIDLDALVEMFTEIKSGHTPTENIYIAKRKKEPQTSILFLVDLSLSTDSYSDGNRILDVEKQAVLLFGQVLSEYNVDFAVGGFYSKTRNNCSYISLKDFKDDWAKARKNIGAAEPRGYTRIGPALRHAKKLISEKLAEVTPEVEHVNDLIFSAHTVLARFENTGVVPQENAEKIGLVGYAGRASGLSYDARASFPTECYQDLPDNTNERTDGDVCSRASVRREEIMHSTRLITRLLEKKEETTVCGSQDHQLAADSFVVTINEGWRGEVSHCILTDQDGSILRYKVKDPSFHNWTGLALSLRDEGISDFPLCNKSFNLSYCGFDL